MTGNLVIYITYEPYLHVLLVYHMGEILWLLRRDPLFLAMILPLRMFYMYLDYL